MRQPLGGGLFWLNLEGCRERHLPWSEVGREAGALRGGTRPPHLGAFFQQVKFYVLIVKGLEKCPVNKKENHGTPTISVNILVLSSNLFPVFLVCMCLCVFMLVGLIILGFHLTSYYKHSDFHFKCLHSISPYD